MDMQPEDVVRELREARKLAWPDTMKLHAATPGSTRLGTLQ